MTERDFTAAAEWYLDMVYRLALNCLRVPADAEDAPRRSCCGYGSGQSPFQMMITCATGWCA